MYNYDFFIIDEFDFDYLTINHWAATLTQSALYKAL